MATKYLFIVGGVMSSVGKGIAAASIGKILQSRGHSVTALKIDPYINVDAGTMNPTEHGEVFVTTDGDETDQDIGNYERFLNTTIPSKNYMTTGRVYLSVITKERSLYYKGKCVEVVPHVPLEVIDRITAAAEGYDVALVEIGGTVGEYQSVLFLEAIRMMKIKHPADVGVVMVSYLPIPSKVGEMKTKPTQHAVRSLNSAGIFPDFLLCRADRPLDAVRKEKLALFCNVPKERIISAPDVESIYDIPLNFEKESLGVLVEETLGLPQKKGPGMDPWRAFVERSHSKLPELSIGIVGKYFETGEFTLSDAYLSVIEALKYSAYQEGRTPVLHWINAEDFEKDPGAVTTLSQYDGILVPGGFGTRGIEGKLSAIRYARENKIPYFGLCYGMQLLVIEYARTVAGLSGASSKEIAPDAPYVVVDVMESQKEHLKKDAFGGSMRLGSYEAILKPGTLAHQAYGTDSIQERHRHRYEVSLQYVPLLEEKGLVFSGMSPDGTLPEIAELPGHPFFLGTQFHPEFLARPLTPHPLFTAFIKAAIQNCPIV